MTPSDPLYSAQWHFALIGDIQTIWEDYDGSGVVVGVYDDGIDYNHEDLDDNYDASIHAEDDLGNPLGGYPYLFEPDGDGHGTSVAGLIAGEANNGAGGTGVAFGATLAAVKIFDPTQYGYVNGDEAAFMDVASQAVLFDISQNSWGATPVYDAGLDDGGFADELDAVYQEVVRTGRDGLGTIITQAAGNDDMDGNGDGVNASRFTITVAATDQNGDAAYYSNFGASILIAAPAAAVTTDLTGAAGYDPTDYTTEFGGTSAATPVTSGVVALMLDANPNLGWRDVQNILAASATLTGTDFDAAKAGPEEEGTWDSNGASTWNGGGYHIHTNYGYGMINAYNAVRMAEVWTLFQPAQTSANERMVSGKNDFADVTVPDGGNGVTRTIQVDGNIDIDHVQLTLDVDSEQIMDLKVLLTSPDGTTITVALDDSMILNPFDSLDGTWTYGIDGLKGESSQGTWTVQVFDMRAPNKTTELQSAELKIYGSTPSSDDVYHVTDEFLTMKAFEPGRATIKDVNGGTDWLDFAAVAGNVSVDLKTLRFGVDGQNWGALQGTFEKVVTGDGNDQVTGNSSANEFRGMRGNDTLRGDLGNDRLYGGEDRDNLFGGDGNDALYGELGNDTLTADAGADTLYGGDGTDSLRGGLGNDAYYYGAGDSVVEAANSGDDKVISSVTVSLSVNVEKLTLTGGGAINGSGNASANVMIGNAGANLINGAASNDSIGGGGGVDWLIGGDGNDTLDGGTGNDMLTGGAGSDVFKFTTAPSATNVDGISDFKPGTDKIYLENAVFSGLAAGALSAAAFASNNVGTAMDASDRIIYEKDTGILWHDSNGSALGGRVQFAQLDTGLNLTAADFFII